MCPEKQHCTNYAHEVVVKDYIMNNGSDDYDTQSDIIIMLNIGEITVSPIFTYISDNNIVFTLIYMLLLK